LKKGPEEDREGPSFTLSESETQTDEELPNIMVKRFQTHSEIRKR